jgi:hypothetical protein
MINNVQEDDTYLIKIANEEKLSSIQEKFINFNCEIIK